jgi:hypothetical protein
VVDLEIVDLPTQKVRHRGGSGQDVGGDSSRNVGNDGPALRDRTRLLEFGEWPSAAVKDEIADSVAAMRDVEGNRLQGAHSLGDFSVKGV